MSGVSLEVLTARAEPGASRVPVVFVHGICHGAWVWEKYLPYFAAAGHDGYAVSLRGHAGSGGDLHSAGLADYVDDVRSVVGKLDRKPVLIGHSMGGAVAQKYLGEHADSLAAAVLFAPATVGGVPRADLYGVLRRSSLRGFVAWLRIATGHRVSDRATAATPFFSKRLSPEEVAPYAARLQEESKQTFEDLGHPYTSQYDVSIPVLIIGSAADDWFDAPSLRKTAAAYGVEPVILEHLCHDMMLDPDWRLPADHVLDFIARVTETP